MGSFCGVCHRPQSTEICPVHCVMIPYGSKHGSKMWSCYGSAKQAAFTAEFGLYDTFKTTLDSLFRGLRCPGFQKVFHSLFSSHPPVPGCFLPLPVISFPGSNMGQKHGSDYFPSPGENTDPTPRCRDCTIAIKNCKSFLSKRNCRRTVSIDPTRRQLSYFNSFIKRAPYCSPSRNAFRS